MENQVFKSIFVVSMITMLCGTLFSCDKDDDEEAVPKCYVDKTNLSFDSKKGDAKELSITCSGKWEISDVPDWLVAESTGGWGKATVRFTTNKSNKTSKPNQGYMTVIFSENGTSETVRVEQLGNAVSNCEVTPNLIVTLSNGIAFDFNFDTNVARYYRGYIEASSAGRMSDEEIITALERDFSRHVPSDDEVADFDNLEAGTRYIIYTLGYDKEGNRGDLVATEVTTLAKKSNEPVGRISNLKRSGLYWNWTVTKSATCSSYYMMSSEDYYIAYASDVLQAWWIEYAAKNGTVSEYVNGTDWKQLVEDGSLFAVWTRGVDARGNSSGTIEWKGLAIASTRAAGNIKGNGSKDHSGRKLQQDQYRLYKIEQ